MMNFLNPRHWFQKTTGAFSTAQTEVRNRMRYNALFMLDPDVLVRHLAAFAAGDISGLEHVIDEFESRDDKMKIGAFKMSAAVASKPWEVRINKGEEDNERARLHKEVLTRFWNRIRVTDAFCRNRRGGVRMLVKQMMSAQSRVYAVHDVTWKTRGDGELEATFTQIPAWCFENRTGELRYIQDPGGYTGVPMKDGEWLVTVGEGVGVTATVLAMAKRLSWNDWLLFSEKCGMPVILANTGAKQDTPAWKALEAAVASIAPKTGLLADLESKIQAVSIGGSSGQTTYRELVETVDRSISALYRGGDLATMSQGVDGVGSNAQDGESELMDADGCAMIGETLNEQIERHVIRFTCGDFEPLAGIVINPPAETEDIDREIKIDQHLGEFGVKLSKKDMLERYGRAEATSEDDAATRKVGGDVPTAERSETAEGRAPFGGFANEAQDLPAPAGQIKEAGQRQQGQDLGKSSEDVLKAFSKDTGPAADAIKELLKNPSKEAAAALLGKLDTLLPEDPEMAAVLSEAMAAEFGTADLSNEVQRVPGGHGNGGQFTGATNQPRDREHSDKGFQDRYGNGNPETLAENPEMNIERGKAVFTRLAWKQHGSEPHAMYRRDIGWIGVEAGTAGNPSNEFKGGSGIAHILAKHKGAEKEIADVIQHGKVYHHAEEDAEHPNFRKLTIVHENNLVVVSKFRDGRTIITSFDPGVKTDKKTGDEYIDEEERKRYLKHVTSTKPFGGVGK